MVVSGQFSSKIAYFPFLNRKVSQGQGVQPFSFLNFRPLQPRFLIDRFLIKKNVYITSKILRKFIRKFVRKVINTNPCTISFFHIHFQNIPISYKIQAVLDQFELFPQLFQSSLPIYTNFFYKKVVYKKVGLQRSKK